MEFTLAVIGYIAVLALLVAVPSLFFMYTGKRVVESMMNFSGARPLDKAFAILAVFFLALFWVLVAWGLWLVFLQITGWLYG